MSNASGLCVQGAHGVDAVLDWSLLPHPTLRRKPAVSDVVFLRTVQINEYGIRQHIWFCSTRSISPSLYSPLFLLKVLHCSNSHDSTCQERSRCRRKHSK